MRRTLYILFLALQLISGPETIIFAQNDSMISVTGRKAGFAYAKFYPMPIVLPGIKAGLLLRAGDRIGLNFTGRWQKSDRFRSKQYDIFGQTGVPCHGPYVEGDIYAFTAELRIYNRKFRHPQFNFFHGPALYYKSAFLRDAVAATGYNCQTNVSKWIDVDRKSYGVQYLVGGEFFWKRFLLLECHAGLGARLVITDEISDTDIPVWYFRPFDRDLAPYWKYLPSAHLGFSIGFGY